MKKNLIPLFIILFFYSCTRDPHSVGSSILGPNDESYQINNTTIYASYDTTFSYPLLNSSSTRLLAGKTDSLETQILIKFSNELADSLKNATIDTVQLMLIPMYRWNVKSPTLTFEVGVTSSSWSDSSTKSNSPFPTITSTTKQFTDSMQIAVPVNILLDTNFISNWRKSKNDSTVTDFGFTIRTKSKDGIIGFASLNEEAKFNEVAFLKPKLTIRYKKPGKDTTLEISVSNGNDTYVSKTDINFQNNLVVQGAIHQQTRVGFNFSLLGKNAIINSAILELSAKTSSTILGSNSKDSLEVFFAFSKDSTKIDSISYFPTILGKRILTLADTAIYSFNMTGFSQMLVRDSLLNYSFAIKTLGDVELADRFVFYNRNSPQTVRPRLKIIYSLKK